MLEAGRGEVGSTFRSSGCVIVGVMLLSVRKLWCRVEITVLGSCRLARYISVVVKMDFSLAFSSSREMVLCKITSLRCWKKRSSYFFMKLPLSGGVGVGSEGISRNDGGRYFLGTVL